LFIDELSCMLIGLMFAWYRRFALLCSFWWLSLSAVAGPHAEHVFIISLDGGKPSVMQESPMPIVSGLLAEGAHTWTAKTIVPSKTLPSHVSMLTGFSPAKHHVLWNDWIPTNGLVRVPTIFADAKAADMSTAMFVGKEKFKHLVQPDTVDDFVFRSAVSEPVTKAVAGEKKTTEGTVHAKYVAQAATAYILQKKPNLCFIHFTDCDDSGHDFGWGSKQQIQAFANVDAAIGAIIKAIRDAGIARQSVVIITADHGGHEKTHGLSTPPDMYIPWIVWGAGVKHGFTITAPVVTYDTAATALWLLGVPRPKNLDGFPVSSAFE
jgi:predicted AlkP superfamily pyrophosphatase or phosphodiesterase